MKLGGYSRLLVEVENYTGVLRYFLERQRIYLLNTRKKESIIVIYMLGFVHLVMLDKLLNQEGNGLAILLRAVVNQEVCKS